MKLDKNILVVGSLSAKNIISLLSKVEDKAYKLSIGNEFDKDDIIKEAQNISKTLPISTLDVLHIHKDKIFDNLRGKNNG